MKYKLIVSSLTIMAMALVSHAQISVTNFSPGTSASGTSATNGEIATSSNFDLNGGNAVALIFTSEGAGDVDVRFAGKEMKSVTGKISSKGMAQEASIFYLIDPEVTEGTFVIKGAANTEVSYAYSPIALKNVKKVATEASDQNDSSTDSITLAYTTNTDSGVVLLAAVNNAYGRRPAPKLESGNAGEILLPATVEGTSGHFHTVGIVEKAGTYEEVVGNPFERNAVSILALDAASTSNE